MDYYEFEEEYKNHKIFSSGWKRVEDGMNYDIFVYKNAKQIFKTNYYFSGLKIEYLKNQGIKDIDSIKEKCKQELIGLTKHKIDRNDLTDEKFKLD